MKDANNTWTKITFDFTAPEGVTSASLLVRNTTKESELYWDAISIMGEGDASAAGTSTGTANTGTSN